MVFTYRLDHAHVVLIIATELDEWLNNLESVLVNQHGITTDPTDIAEQHEDLLALKREFKIADSSIQKLKAASAALPDVQLTETNRIIDRWERAGLQIEARIPKIEETGVQVTKLRECLQNEMSWLQNTFSNLTAAEVLPFTIAELLELQRDYAVCVILTTVFISFIF